MLGQFRSVEIQASPSIPENVPKETVIAEAKKIVDARAATR